MKIYLGKVCTQSLESEDSLAKGVYLAIKSEDSLGKGVYLVVRKWKFTWKKCVPNR